MASMLKSQMWRNPCLGKRQGTSSGQTERAHLWQLLLERDFIPRQQIDKLQNNVRLQFLNGHQQVVPMNYVAPPCTLVFIPSAHPYSLLKVLPQNWWVGVHCQMDICLLALFSSRRFSLPHVLALIISCHE